MFLTTRYHSPDLDLHVQYLPHVMQSMPITSVRRSWPMQILKGPLYVMNELLKMTDVS